MNGRALGALALADYRERTRRPAYLVTLAAAVALGYLALPPADSVWVIIDAGGYRGVYNSAYAGTATALAGALWLMVGGFYVVSGAIARDERTRVGQILATTPLSRGAYLTGKFCSNLLVLASMAGALVLTALVLQLARGESRAVDPVALLGPFVLLTMPVLALTAAGAVLFETIPGLRKGLGNIAWLVLWMFTAIAGGGLPWGGLDAIAMSMREAMTAQHLPAAAELSVGFTKVDQPPDTFAWQGLEATGGFITGRLILLLIAVAVAVLPAIWFGRFDPARDRPRGARPMEQAGVGAIPAYQPAVMVGAGHATRQPRASVYKGLLLTRSRRGLAAARLHAGELRILLQGVPLGWWLVAGAVNVASLAIPANLTEPEGATTALLLSAAWIWPVLIWSRLGTQRRENGLDTLLDSYPGVLRQLAAEWAAGFTLAVLTGFGPLLRMALEGDRPGLTAWAAAAVFIPSFALMLGATSGTHRVFQVVYAILWYAAVNQVAAADYMGTVLVDGQRAGPSPSMIAAVSVAMLAITFGLRAARHANR